MGAGQGAGLPASRVGCPREAAGASASTSWAWDGAAGADGHLPRVRPGGQPRSAPPSGRECNMAGTQPRTPGARRRPARPGPGRPNGQALPQHAPTRHHTLNSGQETSRRGLGTKHS